MIDCHFHIRYEDSSTREQRAAYADSLREEADALGIHRFCCIMESGQRLQEPQDMERTRRNNELLGKYVAEHPDLIDGWARVNPEWGDDAVAEFRRAVEEDGLMGLKLWTEYRCSEPKMFPLAEAAIDMDVPMLIHVLHRIEPLPSLPNESFPEDVLALARRFPELKIVEAHIGGGNDWEYRLKNSQHQENLYVDISGSTSEYGMIECAVETIGANRLVFGTDNSLIESVGRLADADIDEEERETIANKMADLLPGGGR